MKDELNCIGCNACYNICPNNAITMSHNKYGFLQPLINKNRCINCGLCKKICLAIDNIFFQNPKSTYIIQSKNKSYIEKSSSGGMFAELAKYVISKNGVVFGCSMERIENGFDIKHIYIENEDFLYKIQGSKYVQSDIGNSYKQVQKFLKAQRTVLFSGTPCQIAGLKSFLGNLEYENLLTVDLSCTGTPNKEIFNEYIKFLENKYKQKITNFEFRNKKKLGWSCGNALITFANGKQKILYNNISSYLNLFMHKKIQQTGCQNCKYTGLKRISDITIADAWGLEYEYPNLLKNKFDKNKGISLVLLNSNKAQIVFNLIQSNFIFENIAIKKLIKYNNPLSDSSKIQIDNTYLEEYTQNGYSGLENLFKKNQGKKYYYNILKNKTPLFIKKIIKTFMKKAIKTDCLLMTLYCLNNYGSLLTAYALQKTINDLGYSSKLIHYGNIYGYGYNFIKKYLPLTTRCINVKDFIKLNKLSDCFIVGSDNLINLNTNKFEVIAQNLFNYTDNNKKRIMISGSIGSWNGNTKNQEEHKYFKYLLERFDYLSTREEIGKNIFKEKFDCNADWINDPVFYLEKEDYIELIKDVKENYNNKIMQYILYPTKETKAIVEHFKQHENKKIVKFYGNENVKCFNKNKVNNVENWLAAIIHSDLIITDSFHCVAFSLIFNKPFVCIKNKHATIRFLSLFHKLGINIPLIESVNELNNLNLNYDKIIVNKNLLNIKNFALEKIENALLQEKIKKDNDVYTELEFQKLNKKYLSQTDLWYKKNRLFYFGIIILFVLPLIKLKKDLKNKNAKNN